MTDRSKFEQMLEHLVNEDQEAAKEIFHQIVVEKSREIYENILAEDFDMDEAKDEDEEMEEAKDEEDEDPVDEAKDEEDEEVEEDFSFDEGDDEGDGPVGGDPSDDMLKDIEAGDDEPSMDDEGEDIEDRVLDLEDAIDELRAQFEKEFGGEDDSEMGMDDEMSMGDDDEMSDDPMKSYESDNFMREYIEKVGGATYDKFGKMGDDGVNSKSPVAGKNDMGGTTANILSGRNGSDAGEAGTAGGQLKGNGVLKGKPQDMNTGNINVPGGKAGKTAFTKKEPGHGAEKKGAAEQADNRTSPLSGLKSRAK
jgi:hypothetical protein